MLFLILSSCGFLFIHKRQCIYKTESRFIPFNISTGLSYFHHHCHFVIVTERSSFASLLRFTHHWHSCAPPSSFCGPSRRPRCWLLQPFPRIAWRSFARELLPCLPCLRSIVESKYSNNSTPSSSVTFSAKLCHDLDHKASRRTPTTCKVDFSASGQWVRERKVWNGLKLLASELKSCMVPTETEMWSLCPLYFLFFRFFSLQAFQSLHQHTFYNCYYIIITCTLSCHSVTRRPLQTLVAPVFLLILHLLIMILLLSYI